MSSLSVRTQPRRRGQHRGFRGAGRHAGLLPPVCWPRLPEGGDGAQHGAPRGDPAVVQPAGGRGQEGVWQAEPRGRCGAGLRRGSGVQAGQCSCAQNRGITPHSTLRTHFSNFSPRAMSHHVTPHASLFSPHVMSHYLTQHSSFFSPPAMSHPFSTSLHHASHHATSCSAEVFRGF